jgi:hypothetical protein
MPDDLLDSVSKNCNLLWGSHNAFANAGEGTRFDAFLDMVMLATQKEGELLAAGATLGIDLTAFSVWLLMVQKAHEQAGRTAKVDQHADDSWPSVHAAIQRLRYGAGAAIHLAADAAGPSEGGGESTSGYTTLQLSGLADVSSDTISRKARDIGVTRPAKGKRNHRYTPADALLILQYMRNSAHGNDATTLDNAINKIRK